MTTVFLNFFAPYYLCPGSDLVIQLGTPNQGFLLQPLDTAFGFLLAAGEACLARTGGGLKC